MPWQACWLLLTGHQMSLIFWSPRRYHPSSDLQGQVRLALQSLRLGLKYRNTARGRVLLRMMSEPMGHGSH